MLPATYGPPPYGTCLRPRVQAAGLPSRRPAFPNFRRKFRRDPIREGEIRISFSPIGSTDLQNPAVRIGSGFAGGRVITDAP